MFRKRGIKCLFSLDRFKKNNKIYIFFLAKLITYEEFYYLCKTIK
jgi:hypothetical protein